MLADAGAMRVIEFTCEFSAPLATIACWAWRLHFQTIDPSARRPLRFVPCSGSAPH